MLKELQKRFNKEIPMTKLMGLELKSLDDKELITSIPIDININDKGTAFGGSSSALAIISGWIVSVIIADKLNLSNTMIAIVNNQSAFKAPILKDLVCHTYLPTEDEINSIKKRLIKKGLVQLR